MKNKIVKSIKKTLGKASLGLKKHSSEILIVAGVAGTVVSAVIACKATTKISDILAETKKDINTIHECVGKTDLAEKYTEEDSRKDLAVVYVQTGVKLAKLYAPAVILGSLSIAAMITSNHILRKRNIALATAYTAVDKGFKEYRSRVIERFGEEVDKELKYNIKAKMIEETIVDEDGREITVEKEVKVGGEGMVSPYARFFDESCPEWEKDSEYNAMFLNSRQQYANDLLKAKGHLFLNEVYDMLGIPRTKAGQIVGWIYDPDNPLGDNYVDFGMYDINREKARDFVNGYERSILLDFNVDGEIINRIGEADFYA